MNIVITSAEITSLWGAFWWPFVRIGAVLLSMPFFGDALISVRIRTFNSVWLFSLSFCANHACYFAPLVTSTLSHFRTNLMGVFLWLICIFFLPL